MKTQRVGGGGLEIGIQFSPKFVSEVDRDFVVAAQGAIDVSLDPAVVADLHFPRSRSTRRTSSSWVISSARPLSRSASRWQTSSSVISASIGGRGLSNENV